MSIRIDAKTHNEILDISFYERKKPSTWARDILIAAVKRYQRNPQYKKHKRDIDAALTRKLEALKE